MKAGLLPAAFIGSVVFAHVALVQGNASLAGFLLVATPVLLLVRGWIARGLVLLAAILAYVVGVPATIGQGLPIFYLPPVLINLALAFWFGSTLRPGSTPLITQYSIRLRGRLEPAAADYTRRVTQLWTLLFAFLALESALLALFAPVEVWSLFANLLNYAMIVLFFVGEYLFRLRHLSTLEHPGFLQFLTSIVSMHVSNIRRP